MPHALIVAIMHLSVTSRSTLRLLAGIVSKLLSFDYQRFVVLKMLVWHLQLRTITQRVNTRSGRTYADDPAVFAWELCNECQCVAVSMRLLAGTWHDMECTVSCACPSFSLPSDCLFFCSCSTNDNVEINQ